MKLIFVSDHAHINGGLARVAIAEAAGLARRGHEVHFFSATDSIEPDLLDAGVQVETLGQNDILSAPPSVAVRQGLFNQKAVSHLRRKLKRFSGSSDCLVHFHSWMKALSPGILSVPSECGVRSTVTFHDYFLACPNGAFLEHPSAKICRRNGLSLSCLACNCDSRNYGHKIWRYLRFHLQTLWMKSPQAVDHYISVSSFNADKLRDRIPNGKPLHILRNPVEVKPVDRSRAEENKSFLFIGRFSAEKGAHLFAEAVRRRGFPAVFVGDGELSARLHEIAPDARFTGWLDSTGVMTEIRQARALVFPSLWYEAQPLTPVEAMSQGTPVVTSDQCAAIDVVRDGWSGLHFRTGSIDSLESTLNELHRDSSRVKRLSENAYQWYWNDPWSLSKHLEELEDIYSKVIQRR